jgi:hypothetical protein
MTIVARQASAQHNQIEGSFPDPFIHGLAAESLLNRVPSLFYSCGLHLQNVLIPFAIKNSQL